MPAACARRRPTLTASLPPVGRFRGALACLPAGSLLDGEVISLRRSGGDWGRVQEVTGAASRTGDDLTYVVFDILTVNGTEVRGLTLVDRRRPTPST
jgi:ATP-dependent DNA ligase